jgi:hypothetical protein
LLTPDRRMDKAMKREFSSFVFAALLAGALAASAQAQSLGEVARQERAKKPAPSPNAKVYTNDTIPAAATASISSGETSSERPAASSAAAPSTASDASESTSAEDRAKAEADWKQKFGEQRKDIARIERELDVLKRENKLRAATFYSDAGNRLRDEKKYAEEDRRYQAEVTAKEQELAAAKQKFENMQEEARKAGMPSRVSDPE